MNVQELIQDTMIGKLESALEDIDHTISFVNVSGNKWQAVIAFDLDASNMNEVEKELISALLKRL